jgi:hypothetical protein
LAKHRNFTNNAGLLDSWKLPVSSNCVRALSPRIFFMINKIERAAVLLLLVCTAFAQTGGRGALVWEPRLFNATDQVPKGTIGKDIVSDLRVLDRTVVLEETKLTDLQAHFKATIGNRGDAGDYVEWLCFYGANSNWVLWLTSGEIDAGAIGGFQWQLVPATSRIDRRCRQLTDSAVKLPNAIRLGIPERDLFRIMGQPTKREGQRFLYVHEEPQAIRNQPYTETNVVVVNIRNGVVSAIAVSKSTIS